MEKEIWKNVSKGVALINVYDHNNAEVQRMVRSQKTIEVTEKERLHLNTERAMRPGTDVFSSGAMVPVQLLETTSDKAEIEANPNQLTDKDITELLSLQWKKFDTAIADVTNIQALERLYDMADADDNTTVRQLDAIKARILEVYPAHIFED